MLANFLPLRNKRIEGAVINESPERRGMKKYVLMDRNIQNIQDLRLSFQAATDATPVARLLMPSLLGGIWKSICHKSDSAQAQLMFYCHWEVN